MIPSNEADAKVSTQGQSARTNAFVRRFYAPLALAFALAVAALFDLAILRSIPIPPGLEAEINYWMFSLKLPVSTNASDSGIIRLLCGLAAIALLFYAVSLDFSQFFPSLLKLEVFYDVEGIKSAVEELHSQEKVALEIDGDWMAKIAEYDLDVITGLRSIWQKNRHPDAWPSSGHPRPYFTGSGYTTFNVSRTGLLSYQIVEATGRLTYAVKAPRDEWTFFPGASKLVPTIHNYIRPRLLDLLLTRSILIRPEFAQVFGVAAVHDGIGPQGHDHTLIAVTRITLFPLPTFGDTLYLWLSKSGSKIPIARSVYT